MFGFRDFPSLKWKFALNLQRICTAYYSKLKIARLNALYQMRFSFLFKGKIHCRNLLQSREISRKTRTEHFRYLRF